MDGSAWSAPRISSRNSRQSWARPRIAKYVREGANEQVRQLFLHAASYADADQPPNVCRDASDDFLLALAAASGADLLVTRDADLLSIGQYGKTRIIYPAQLLQLLSAGGGEAS